MSGYLSYELRTYTGGTWRVDSVYDDLRIALHEARLMQQSGRYSAVRLVEERYNQATGNYLSKTVYRATKTDGANAAATDAARRTHREIEACEPLPCDDAEDIAYDDEPPTGAGAVGLTLRFGFIVLGGIAAILAMRHFFGQI